MTSIPHAASSGAVGSAGSIFSPGPSVDSSQIDTIDALSRCRFAVLERTNAVMTSCTADGAPAEALDTITRLLMTSLEELKVAEEELRAQNAVLVERQAMIDARTRYYTELFVHTPVPTLVTDLFATINEANVAAGKLLNREPHYLERKPIAALVVPPHRAEFRKQLSRFVPEHGVCDWRLSLNRVGDTPIDVRATVKLVRGLGATASGVLCWTFANPTHGAGAFEGV